MILKLRKQGENIIELNKNNIKKLRNLLPTTSFSEIEILAKE